MPPNDPNITINDSLGIYFFNSCTKPATNFFLEENYLIKPTKKGFQQEELQNVESYFGKVVKDLFFKWGKKTYIPVILISGRLMIRSEKRAVLQTDEAWTR